MRFMLTSIRCYWSLLISLTLFSACSHSVHQVFVSSLDPDVKYGRGDWIWADTKDFIILGFRFNSDYVEKAVKELESKCSGRVAQVTAEHLTSYKFLSYDQKLVLKGYCLSNKS